MDIVRIGMKAMDERHVTVPFRECIYVSTGEKHINKRLFTLELHLKERKKIEIWENKN